MPRKAAKIALAVVVAIMLLPLLALATDMPHEALRYQRDLTRNARLAWGLDAPVATFAAQIHQESRWRLDAQSPVGALGIAQFMPSTAAWISGAYPALGANAPSSPAWSLRALAAYDRYLWQHINASDDCSRMAMALSAYNGGLGWVYRDQRLAAAKTLNPAVWFGQVEKINAGRAPAMFAENRGYPRAILLKWQPIYALWGGGIQCG
ncbi:MAG TPA: transglycosylase SLT domain-containing protein [Gallionella sp.]|nr:transglycosylase SLT domain-containing protein [Gallionella sp.]